MIATEKPIANPEPRHGATSAKSIKLLAVVEGTAPTARVLDYVRGLSESAKVEVVLLNVQPQPAEGRLRGYGSFKRKDIEDRLVNDLGKRAIAAAGKRLDQAGITHIDRIELGEDAAMVMRVASEERCDAIVVGAASARPLSKWLTEAIGISIGSSALRLAALADMPVIVVK